MLKLVACHREPLSKLVGSRQGVGPVLINVFAMCTRIRNLGELDQVGHSSGCCGNTPRRLLGDGRAPAWYLVAQMPQTSTLGQRPVSFVATACRRPLSQQNIDHCRAKQAVNEHDVLTSYTFQGDSTYVHPHSNAGHNFMKSDIAQTWETSCQRVHGAG